MDARTKFSRLYRHQVEKIYRFIFFKVESQETAEDLTSEVFRKAWVVYQASFEPRSAQKKIKNPRAFLYQIARNVLVDYYRSQPNRSSVSSEDLELVDNSQNTEEVQNQKLDMARLYRALRGLKEEYQDVLIQHYLNNLSLREIARDSGQSLAAVKTTIHRARKALKKAVEGLEEEKSK